MSHPTKFKFTSPPHHVDGDEEQSDLINSVSFKLQSEQKVFRTITATKDISDGVGGSVSRSHQCQNGDGSFRDIDDVDSSSYGLYQREPKRRKLGLYSSRSPTAPYPPHHIDLPSDKSFSSPTTAPTRRFRSSVDPTAFFDDNDLAQEDEPLKPLPGEDFPPPTPPEEYSLSSSSLSDHYNMEEEDRPQTPTNPSAPLTSNPSTTPAALRMGSISLTHETHLVDDYRELLKYELEGCSHLCGPMRFLKEVLAWDSSKWSSIIDTLSQDQDFQAAYLKHSNRYFEAMEDDQYAVWKELRDLVLKRVEVDFDSTVGRRTCDWEDTHDTMLHGSKAGRKPDYCGVVAGWEEGKVPYWDDVVFWEEFKRTPPPLRRKKEGEEEADDEQVDEKQEKASGNGEERKGTASATDGSAVTDSAGDGVADGSGKGRSKGAKGRPKTGKPKNRASSQGKASGSGKGKGGGKSRASESLDVPSTSSSSGKRKLSTNPQVFNDDDAAQPSQPSQSSKTSKTSQNSDQPSEVNFTLPMLQAAGYAVECLSSFCLRLWSVGTFIEDGTVQLMYYDRAGAIVSEKWRIFSQVEGEQTKFIVNFLTLILGFSFCPPSQHGYDQEWIQPTSLPRPKLGKRDTEPLVAGWQRRIGGVCFTANNQISHPQGYGLVTQAPRIIRGRVTSVPSQSETLKFQEDTPGTSGRQQEDEQEEQGDPVQPNPVVNLPTSVVVKVSWQLTSREKEFELIELAESKGVHGLPEILARSHGKKLSELPRARLVDNFDLNQDRSLSLMVIPEYKSFAELDDAESARAFKEIIQTHRDLYQKGRILHRDISINNLFADPNYSRRPNGKFGILLDLNRAIRVDKEYNHHPSTRTGTLPFMAVELTRRNPPPPLHIYEHDVESFFWMLVWSVAFDSDKRLGLRWKTAKKFPQGISYIFHGRDRDTVAMAKMNFLDSFEYQGYLRQASANLRKTLVAWTWDLWVHFQDIRYQAGKKSLQGMSGRSIVLGQQTETPEAVAPYLSYEKFQEVFLSY